MALENRRPCGLGGSNPSYSAILSVNAVLQRVPLPILQKWLGHSDIKNTMVYLQILSQDTRDFYEALEF